MSHEISVMWSRVAGSVVKSINETLKGRIVKWHKNGVDYIANGKYFEIRILEKKQ